MCAHISVFWLVAISALVLFGSLRAVFRRPYQPNHTFFFDPQDCFRDKPEGRVLPHSAEDATFEPMLKHYIGVTQLMVTVAAASIAFGNPVHLPTSIVVAKLILAWSIFFGVLFCALLLYCYDEYSQNMKSYTLGWYSTVFALGFSGLSCFIVGYLTWGWGLIETSH
jgi:hypothetical protein